MFQRAALFDDLVGRERVSLSLLTLPEAKWHINVMDSREVLCGTEKKEDIKKLKEKRTE